MPVKTTESGGGVVVGPDGRILVVNQNGNSWSLPKGHIDPGEDAFTAAKREIYEEAGVVELHYIRSLGSYERFRIGRHGSEDRSAWKKITMFLFQTTQVALHPQDSENPEVRWVPREHVADLLTHPKDKEFFLRVLSELV